MNAVPRFETNAPAPYPGFPGPLQYGPRTFGMQRFRLLPPHSDEEAQSLRASVLESGIRDPIKIDPDDCVIDGHHRILLAYELGLPLEKVPILVINVTGEEADSLAVSLNVSRRQLDKEQYAALIVSLHVDHRWSKSKVARAVGVDRTTVIYWLNKMGIKSPETVKGDDNKEYPSNGGRGQGVESPHPGGYGEGWEITDDDLDGTPSDDDEEVGPEPPADEESHSNPSDPYVRKQTEEADDDPVSKFLDHLAASTMSDEEAAADFKNRHKSTKPVDIIGRAIGHLTKLTKSLEEMGCWTAKCPKSEEVKKALSFLRKHINEEKERVSFGGSGGHRG